VRCFAEEISEQYSSVVDDDDTLLRRGVTEWSWKRRRKCRCADLSRFIYYLRSHHVKRV